MTTPGSRLDRSWPLAMLVVAFVAVMAGVFGQFLFGDKVLLFTDIGSDTYYNYYANYYLLASHLSQFELPLWSFQLGAGSSQLTLYQFLYDPFSIVFYLGGVENLSRLIVWVYALKVACAGAFTYAYLRYLGVGPAGRTVAALLFAFSGFLMGFGQHHFYATWLVFLPLFLLTIELWFRGGRWLPLVLCTAWMALNIAICWQVGVFCIFYVLAKVGIEWQLRSPAEWGRKLLATAGVVALGLALAAVLWLPEYHVLSSSPRIGGSFSDSIRNTFSGFFRLYEPEYYRTLLSRLFSNNLEGIGSAYTGYQNYYESPQFFVGMLPLLLIPQMFVALAPRTRWFALGALLAAVWLVLTPGFSQLMNGFQYPHTRWGYNIVMFELLLAAVVLDRLIAARKINLPVLALTVLVLVGGIVLVYLQGAGKALDVRHYANKRLVQSIVFVALYAPLLWWLVRGRQRTLALGVMLALLGGEMVLEHRDSFARRSVLAKGMEQDRSVHFFDHGNQAAKNIAARDPGFYRVEKNHWLLSLNDSLIQGYRGLDSYQSLNNPSYMAFLEAMGNPAKGTAIAWNSLEDPRLADLLSVKYHLTKAATPLPEASRLLERVGDVSVYERTGALPFGFTYESQVPLASFVPLNAAGRAHALMQGALLDSATAAPLPAVAAVAADGDATALKQALRQDVLRLERMEDDRIAGTIRLAKPKLLFLSIPFDKGWTARVDGQRQDLLRVNIGFSGLYLPAGEHRIELAYLPPRMATGAVISGLALVSLLVLFGWSRRRPPTPARVLTEEVSR